MDPRIDLREVKVKVAYVKLGEIDTIKEQYSVDVFVQARWREDSLKGKKARWREDSLKGKKASDVDFSKLWNPQIVLQNLVSHSKYKEWREIREGKDGTYVVERRRIKGVFSEHLELYDFPFDSQHLGIIITTELPCSEVDLKLDENELSTVELGSFEDEQEWKLRDFTHSHSKTIKKDFREDTNSEYTVLTVVCEAQRRPGFFMWNIILIMTIICTLSFATFAVSVKKPENRLQLGFTLTLTGVAFRFVTNQSLPKIPYLTQLDKYILFCMIFNFLVCVWHASVSKMTDSDEQLTADMWAFVAFIIVYCVFLAVFGTVVLIKWFLHHRRLQVMELEYQKKAAEILKDTWKLKGVTVIPPKTKVHPSD